MSDTVSRLALNTYAAAGFLFQPFTGLLLRWRASRGKEDLARIKERYGFASVKRSPRAVVWVHAASLGETRAVLPLIRRMTDMNFEVVLTTVTTTAAQLAAAELPKGASHQFAPLDLKPYVRRFLKHWRPSLAVFVESELWPATMTELRRQNIPQVIVNARMSQRSFESWKRFGTVTHALFDNLSLCVAQSDEDAHRFAELGTNAVVNAGNLKFDSDPPAVDAGHLTQLQKAISGRPIWLAASTHDQEELIVAKAHVNLKRYFPNLLTLIAPRHPERADQIMEALAPLNLNVAQRSAGYLPGKDTDIYLTDTVGELGLFYRLAPCSLVGGSLVPHGGQNPIEPARLGSAIIHGPNVANFTQIFDALDECGGGHCVRNSEELVKKVAQVLSDKQHGQQMTRSAQAALARFSGALERTHTALLPYLNPLIVAGRLADAEAAHAKYR